ncbi:MAG: uracil-DNA glycosylase [Rhodobacteraceae bacterium]|jgi:uracil-DNA glycosylase|nr:uracil-DNA glycosylase [Paracoccaceae bacterium]MBL4556955.1 uracil-DNA glycosylase [Paracoccaceae bacterium]HBG99050.1 uracil-DNA glycosylase [Paracoccaceae bacterium]
MSAERARLGGWADLDFFDRVWPGIAARLDPDDTLPPRHCIFAALERTQPDRVAVVILGQDPYPTPGHANGLAFSVARPVRPLPASLRNIFRELHDDIGATPADGDLGHWADQGVLLLNTALTVRAGAPGSHARLGWDALAREVLGRLADRPVAALLWGAQARGYRPLLSGPDHLIVESAHPSPLSAHRGFFGSRPFSRVNAWLSARNRAPIDWAGKRALGKTGASA